MFCLPSMKEGSNSIFTLSRKYPGGEDVVLNVLKYT